MPDVYTDIYRDVYGTTVISTPQGGVLIWDGVNQPQLSMLLGLGGTALGDPQGGGAIVLGQGPGLDTGTLGDIGWTDIMDDVRDVQVELDLESEINSASPNRMTFTVDDVSGNYDPTNLNGAFVVNGVSQVEVGMPVWFKATWQDVAYPIFRGVVDDITIGIDRIKPTVQFACTDGLEAFGRVKVSEITPSFAGDLTGTRLGRIADAAQWASSLRKFDAGRATCQPTSFGDFALPLAQQVIETELGTLFVNGNGSLVFWDRWHTSTSPRSTSVRALFSDSGADIELPPDPVPLTRSRSVLFNEVRITRQDGVEQVASDGVSQLSQGIRTLPGSFGTLLETDAAASDMAQWLLGRFKDPDVRLASLTVQAHTQQQWAALLPLAFLDRIRVSLNYGPNTVDRQVLVQGISHDIDRAHWTITLTTRQPDRGNPVVLDVGGPLNTGQLGF